MTLPNSLNETFLEIDEIIKKRNKKYPELENKIKEDILKKIIFIIWVNNIFIENEYFKKKTSIYEWLEKDIKANIDTNLYKVDIKEEKKESISTKSKDEIAKEILYRRFYIEWTMKWYEWDEKSIIEKVIDDYIVKLEKEKKWEYKKENFLDLIISKKINIDIIWNRTLEEYKKTCNERDSISFLIWDINNFSQTFYTLVDKDENIKFWERITDETYSMEIIGIKEKIRIFKDNNKDLNLNIYQTINNIEWLINSLKNYIYVTNTEISNFLIPLKKIRELIDVLNKEIY